MNQYAKNLASLRQFMQNEGIGAYIIPSGDPHLSEYPPEHWKTIAWFSGFTGSAGTLVVTENFAGLWTDSRYFLQAENQLKDTGIELVKLKIAHTPEYIEWLTENLPAGSSVGVDGQLISYDLAKQINQSFAQKEQVLKNNLDLISDIWKNRPELPASKAFVHELNFAGISAKEKLNLVQQEMKSRGSIYHLVSSLDDIAWLLNIRGNDILYNPYVLSHLLIKPGQILLFAHPEKISGEVKSILSENGVELRPYTAINEELTKLTIPGKMLLSQQKVSTSIASCIPQYIQIEDNINPSTKMKACKNEIEIQNIQETMIADGIALVNCFRWIEENAPLGKLTEMSVSEQLEEYRLMNGSCVGPSFASIIGYKSNGAIVHYIPTADNCAKISGEGLLLIDSGGQYLGGTTDITRVLALGHPQKKEIRDYTLVLKGMIALSMAKFPYGTKGYQLEILARKPLWENGLNYGHGTGHGVGYFLGVHEGPQTIGSGASGQAMTLFEPGMVTSVEPGLYREGKYGVRCENLVLTVPDEETEFGNFLRFETLTLCPFEPELIDQQLLSPQELNWLTKYNHEVWNKLSPHLDKAGQAWLKRKTKVQEVQ
jgi:Xaa-Pro aminopeptidase